MAIAPPDGCDLVTITASQPSQLPFGVTTPVDARRAQQARRVARTRLSLLARAALIQTPTRSRREGRGRDVTDDQSWFGHETPLSAVAPGADLIKVRSHQGGCTGCWPVDLHQLSSS
jgi:hypothetical protein